jgi:hypothetical protein
VMHMSGAFGFLSRLGRAVTGGAPHPVTSEEGIRTRAR